MPSVGQVHIDQALTSISVMYRNDSYVADLVFPVVPVQKRSDRFFRFTREDFLSASPLTGGFPASVRRPGSEAAEIDYSLSQAPFFCEEYAYRGLVTDAEAAASDSVLEAESDQTRQLTERLLLDNEVMVAGAACRRANYPAAGKVALTGGGTGTSWGQYGSANSVPLTDIRNGKLQVVKSIAREANCLLLGVDTARVLAEHPTLKELVKYVHQDALTGSGLPRVLRGLTVIEGSAQRNSAAEGAVFSGSNVWAADDGTSVALVFYRNPYPTVRSVSLGYTFEAPDDATGQRGVAVRRWREEKRKGTMLEASFLRDWQLVAVDGSGLAMGGYLISNCTA
jgi:hypothetical protein